MNECILIIICYVLLLQSQAAAVTVQHLKVMHVIKNILVMKTQIALKSLSKSLYIVVTH